jgi:hypothetical protein
MLYPSGSTLDIITEMPTIFVAFTFQFNAFPIYTSMKNRENKERRENRKEERMIDNSQMEKREERRNKPMNNNTNFIIIKIVKIHLGI